MANWIWVSSDLLGGVLGRTSEYMCPKKPGRCRADIREESRWLEIRTTQCDFARAQRAKTDGAEDLGREMMRRLANHPHEHAQRARDFASARTGVMQ